jgi:hypothetical protein
MHRATPIRVLQRQIPLNPVRICKYEPPNRAGIEPLCFQRRRSSPRICTFRSHLKFNPSNIYILASPNSSGFCTYENRGAIPVFRSRGVEFSPALSSRGSCVPSLSAMAGEAETPLVRSLRPDLTATNHCSYKSFGMHTYEERVRKPFRMRTYKTRVFKSFRLHTYANTPPGGTPQPTSTTLVLGGHHNSCIIRGL